MTVAVKRRPPWALVAVSVVYLFTSVIAAWFAIRGDLAGRPFGMESGLPTASDFLYGLGTSLSAPLVLLVLLAILIIMVIRGGRRTRVSFGLMAILGLGFFVGMLAEPIAREVWLNAPLEILPAVLVMSNLLIPIAIVVLAGRAWSQQP